MILLNRSIIFIDLLYLFSNCFKKFLMKKAIYINVSYPTAKEEKSLDFGWASWFTAPSNLGSSPSFIR